MGVQAVQRWRAEARWYEAYIVRDLLGDWTVVRRWGGRTNQLHGQRIEVVSDAPAAQARLMAIDTERRRRGYQPLSSRCGCSC